MNEQYQIPKLDPHLFRGYSEKTLYQERVLESPVLPIIKDIYKGIDRGLAGGIYRSFQGIPFDNKCFPDADIINRLNVIKADLTTYLAGFSTKATILPLIVFLLEPKKWKLETLNKTIAYFLAKTDRVLMIELANCSYSCFFADSTFYCDFGREMMKFLTIFLTEIGIRQNFALRLAEIFTLFIEYDDFYRLVMLDIFTETTKDKVFKSKELRRLGKLLAKRVKDKNLANNKMQGIVNILSMALYLPSIRKAFKKALSQIDFSKFQMDKADRYFALTWVTYDFFGESKEKRKERYMEIHKEGVPQMIKIS